MKRRARVYETVNGNLVFEKRFIADRASRAFNSNDDSAYEADFEARMLLSRSPNQNLIYMVAASEYVGPPCSVRDHNPSITYRADNGEGFGGNSDPNIRRYHGWRGTTNDWSVYAYGVRRCLRVTITGNRSKTVRFVFGKDLKKDFE
jgi:hypothetical protein